MPKTKIPTVVSVLMLIMLVLVNVLVLVALPVQGANAITGVYLTALRYVFVFYSSLICLTVMVLAWAIWFAVWIFRFNKMCDELNSL